MNNVIDAKAFSRDRDWNIMSSEVADVLARSGCSDDEVSEFLGLYRQFFDSMFRDFAAPSVQIDSRFAKQGTELVSTAMGAFSTYNTESFMFVTKILIDLFISGRLKGFTSNN